MQLTDSWSSDVIHYEDFINPEVPAQDLEDLRAKTTTVRTWVNKAVAHKDRAGKEAPPLSEVHGCIDAIFEVFNKYMALIQGVSVSNDVVMTPWTVVFQTLWIPEDKKNEIATAVDRIGRDA
jgi:hypothetical protein